MNHAFTDIFKLIREEQLTAIGEGNADYSLCIGLVNGDVLDIPYSSEEHVRADYTMLVSERGETAVLLLHENSKRNVSIRKDSIAFVYFL